MWKKQTPAELNFPRCFVVGRTARRTGASCAPCRLAAWKDLWLHEKTCSKIPELRLNEKRQTYDMSQKSAKNGRIHPSVPPFGFLSSAWLSEASLMSRTTARRFRTCRRHRWRLRHSWLLALESWFSGTSMPLICSCIFNGPVLLPFLRSISKLGVGILIWTSGEAVQLRKVLVWIAFL